MNTNHCARDYCGRVEIQEDWSIIKGWCEHFGRTMIEIISVPIQKQ